MDTEQVLQDAFLAQLNADEERALVLITGMFVSLTVEMCRQRGLDVAGDIRIDSGGKRDITIHQAPQT